MLPTNIKDNNPAFSPFVIDGKIQKGVTTINSKTIFQKLHYQIAKNYAKNHLLMSPPLTLDIYVVRFKSHVLADFLCS